MLRRIIRSVWTQRSPQLFTKPDTNVALDEFMFVWMMGTWLLFLSPKVTLFWFFYNFKSPFSLVKSPKQPCLIQFHLDSNNSKSSIYCFFFPFLKIDQFGAKNEFTDNKQLIITKQDSQWGPNWWSIKVVTRFNCKFDPPLLQSQIRHKTIW
jgi:hypothetical protein